MPSVEYYDTSDEEDYLLDIAACKAWAQEEIDRATEEYRKRVKKIAKDCSDRISEILKSERTAAAAAAAVTVSAAAEHRASDLPGSETEHAPYVAVLINGDMLHFEQELLKEGAAGGRRAANLMQDAVLKYLEGLIDVSAVEEIVLMVFCHPVMSKAFITGFKKSLPSTKFVEVAEIHAVEDKIADSWRSYTGDSSCKHIILGGCAVSETSIVESDKMTTLCQKDPTNASYTWDLEKTGFDKVFQVTSDTDRTAEAAMLAVKKLAAVLASGHEEMSPAQEVPTTTTAAPDAELCFDFAEGKCNKSGCSLKHTAITKLNPYNLAKAMPKGTGTQHIPVNSKNERLDLYLRRPTTAEWGTYATSAGSNLCVPFHLTGRCLVEKCASFHGPLHEAARYALKYDLFGEPCKQGGQCRRFDCFLGHHCQKLACLRGPHSCCKMGSEMHGINTRIAQWIEVPKVSSSDEVSLCEMAARIPAPPSSPASSSGSTSEVLTPSTNAALAEMETETETEMETVAPILEDLIDL